MNKELPKPMKPTFVNLLVSISTLSLIATLISTFSSSPPELWVSSLNIAGTISVIFYMGLYSSKFTFYRWLILNKRKIYIFRMSLLGIMLLILLFIFNKITMFLYSIFQNDHTEKVMLILDYINKNLIFPFINIFFLSFIFMIFLLLIMAYITRKSIEKR